MRVLTTDVVPAGQRFDFWRDNVAAQFQLQAERVGNGAFRGAVQAKEINGLAFAYIDSGGMRLFRRRTDIARSPVPHLPVYFITLQIGGAGSFCQGTEELGLLGGDIVVLDPLREFELGCERPFRQLCVKLPREWIDTRVARPDLLPGALIRRDHPLAKILASYLHNGFETADTLTPASAAIISEHAVDLLSQALGESHSCEPARPDGLREALFVRACRLIALRYGDPELGPDRIARELGVSTRLLQKIFAERDKTVMRHIFEQRVSRAAKLLAAPGAAHRSITDIAFACGYNDSAHFTRSFAAQMEMTPSQWRKQSL